jgi:hypothetical protein
VGKPLSINLDKDKEEEISSESSQINIPVGGGEGLLSLKEDFGLDITKHIQSIKERFEYMML